MRVIIIIEGLERRDSVVMMGFFGEGQKIYSTETAMMHSYILSQTLFSYKRFGDWEDVKTNNLTSTVIQYKFRLSFNAHIVTRSRDERVRPRGRERELFIICFYFFQQE